MENNQQINIQQKQIFLRNQILQGGLDPESFMDYMGTVKNQGQNIQLDGWTMQELKQVVQDFKKQIKTDTETLEKVQQSQVRQSQEMISKIIKSVIRKQKVNYDKGVWDYELINQHECKTIPRPFSFNPKIKPQVHVLKWQVRSQGGFIFGIGSTKQLWLNIETNFTPKAIERNNSDLQWYRSTLLKTFPGSYIPPLAQLRSVQPQDKKGLTQRSKLIQQFLNSILQYQYIIQSTISKIFFTEADHNRFTNYKNKQRGPYSKTVSRIQTLEGNFDLQISLKNQKYIKNSSLFGKLAQQTYTQIQSQINKVLSDMQTLSKHILYVSNSCGILHQKYAKICNLNEIKDSNMQNIMLYLHNLFSNVGKSIKQQMSLVQQISTDFVASDIRNWEEYILHDRRYNKQLQSYLNFKSQLIRKKQRWINDISKWQLQSQRDVQRVSRMNLSMMEKQQVFSMMFPKDNKVQQEMRIWIAYLNKVYEKSFKMLLKQEQNKLKDKFMKYIQKSASLSNQNYEGVKQFKQFITVAQ